MASTAKYAVDDIISISFRETCAVGEEFLRDFQILDRKQNDIQTTKPVTTLVKSVLNTELACLLLPNEILFKIFGYLDIQEIRLSAQVSHQFNMISKDSSVKPERLIEQKRNP